MSNASKLVATGSGTLSDQVYRGIYQAITLGEWPPGTRLPTENELTKVFGVSRTVIREALIRLRIDGLVMSRQGAGTHVISAPNRSVLEFAEPENISDIQRCYEFRIGVEGETAYLAAQRQSREKIASIGDALRSMKRSYEKAGGGLSVEEDIDFHIAIARATENNFYISTITSGMQSFLVGMRIARSFSHSSKEYQLAAVNEHQIIYDRIDAGDAGGARHAMRHHIESTRRRVFIGR